jgi:hypothetical protein
MSQLSRRDLLQLLGASGIGISSGCTSLPLSSDNERDPGTLVVSNKHSLSHVVKISVDVPKPVKTKNVSRETLQVIKNGLEGQITIDAGKTKVYPDFLSGSIMYTVNMWIDSTEVGTNSDDKVKTAKFSPAAIATPDARGSFLTIQIKQTGKLSWSVTYVQ